MMINLIQKFLFIEAIVKLKCFVIREQKENYEMKINVPTEGKIMEVMEVQGANRKMLHENRRDERRRTGSAAPTVSGGASGGGGGGGGRKKIDSGEFHESCERSQFYHSADLERPAALFVPSDDFFFDTASICSYDALSEMEPQPKRPKSSERIMIYVRKADEDVFTPLHLVPPSLGGLARAISEKYNLDETKIEAFYKQCQKGGITVKIDGWNFLMIKKL
ncbi:unnamed protein product [Meloidogyne enterolobii]|uniref:Uncharacterized protein n=1 Tax=Meloidogyne enterolobii TaxID=390850 RepID=A0ACB0Z9B5_MELEN